MSRMPRAQEYLKTAFTAEAASAARFRAAGRRAEQDGHRELAKAWLALAEQKDGLAIELLNAAGKVAGGETDLASALAEERYENDALYPRMMNEVDAPTAAIFQRVVVEQQQHAARLEKLHDELVASTGDIAVAR